MLDFTWLATEAKNIHDIFYGVFYSLITVLLLIGVFLEYFKFSLGELPSFTTLIGRSFIAAIMLFSFNEFINTLALATDALASQIGDLNEFKLVLSRMGDQLDRLTWSWTSVKRMVIVSLSFLTFFILYISVYLTDAIYLYSWTLLYIFSPILIAMYVLPATASATKALYKSLFIVASWKIVWSVLATLLWSAALLDLDKLGNEASFLTIIVFNIMLAASLLFTPLVANALLGAGVSSIAPKLGGASVAASSLVISRIAAAGRATKSVAMPVVKQNLTGKRSPNRSKAKSDKGSYPNEKSGPPRKRKKAGAVSSNVPKALQKPKK